MLEGRQHVVNTCKENDIVAGDSDYGLIVVIALLSWYDTPSFGIHK